MEPDERRPPARSEAWSPWTSIAGGLLVAAGVTVAVTTTRRRRERRKADGQRPGS